LLLLAGSAQADDFGGGPGWPPPSGEPPGAYYRPPAPPRPPGPPNGWPPGGQGFGGCFGCGYAGDYYGSNVTARRPAPPLRLQGQWRNGWWYY
jgi:hypothetical protein